MSEQINISKKYIEGKCDLKCAYNFLYGTSNSNATNEGTSISIDYEKMDTAPVSFNKKNYFVQYISLKYESSLLYNDKLAPAELRILHYPENTGSSFYVIIPIKISDESTLASSIITDIIKSVALSAPSEGQKVNLGEFSLQKLIPMKPFYNFKYDTSSECIAFDMVDAIPISSSIMDTFKKIITENTFKFKGNPGLYYNSSGPNTTKDVGDGIYISCNPTGNSEETTEVKYNIEKNDSVYDIDNIFNNEIFLIIVQTILACLIFIIIFYVWNYGYNYLDGDVNENVNNFAKIVTPLISNKK